MVQVPSSAPGRYLFIGGPLDGRETWLGDGAPERLAVPVRVPLDPMRNPADVLADPWDVEPRLVHYRRTGNIYRVETD